MPGASIWEQPQRLESWAGVREPMRVGTSCASLQELLRSESFKIFLRIFNTIGAHDAEQRETGRWEPVTGEKITQDQITRDRAHALWKLLQLQGKVDVLHALDENIEKWRDELDGLEEQERELQSRRRDILGS